MLEAPITPTNEAAPIFAIPRFCAKSGKVNERRIQSLPTTLGSEGLTGNIP
jgi:hypothetical protein